MRFLLLFFCIIAYFAAAESAPEIPAPVLELTAGGVTVRAEVADTAESRRVGLSGRAELPAGRGMLLVFAKPRRACLWMRGVEFPLDAAFIGSGGAVAGIVRMEARTETHHCAPSDVVYALEVNAGVLDNVKIGDVVLGLPPPPLLPNPSPNPLP